MADSKVRRHLLAEIFIPLSCLRINPFFRCPNYPQDLIIHLLCGPARIAKVQVLSHHYKIATKIDVYIGILKDPHDVIDDSARQITDGMEDDEDDMIIEFTRLG